MKRFTCDKCGHFTSYPNSTLIVWCGYCRQNDNKMVQMKKDTE